MIINKIMAEKNKIDIFPSGSRLTNQRRIILDYLRGVYTHPTAEIIYKEVKKKLPQISFGTVYRNLSFLKEHDFILELKSADGCTHYDGDPSDHCHFVCMQCGRVYDLEDKRFKKRHTYCEKTAVGKICYCRTNYYGVCKNCKNN